MPYLGRAPTGTGSVTEIDGDLTVTGNIKSGGQLTANDTLFKIVMDTAADLGDNFLIEDGGTDGSGTNAGDDICLEGQTEAVVNLSSNVSFGSGGILETLALVCDGRARTVRSGTYTPQNVTGVQNITTTYTDLNGTTVAYLPPAGTTSVIYDFCFNLARQSDASSETLCKFFIDSDEVTNARIYIGGDNYIGDSVNLRWVIRIGDGTDTDTGRLPSWNTAKTLKWQTRAQSTGTEAKAFLTRFWDGGNATHLMIPDLTITALG